MNCKYCERDDCDTDCYFADRHNGTIRKTAKEWRGIGAAQLRAALIEACDLLDGLVDEVPGSVDWAERVDELREIAKP